MASGTTFDIQIGANATGVTAAADQVLSLSQTLATVSQTATAAAAAVDAGQSAYKRAEAASLGASKAVEKNTVKLAELYAAQQKAAEAGDVAAYRKSTSAIEALAKKQQEAFAHAQAMKGALDGEAKKLDALTAAAKKADAELDGFKKQQAANDAAAGSGKLNEMAEGFGKLGGPVGMLGQKVLGTAEGVKKLFASAGSGKAVMALAAAGVIGLVVALAALAVGIATSIVKIGAWAVGLSDASRSAGLLSAGIAGSVKGGKDLEAALDKMQNKFPQSREELQGMAADLAKTGLKGKALEAALDDAATKAAKLKFGPEWEKQVNALPNLSKRFNQNISSIFGGLKIDGLLSGLGDLVNLFDANTASGKAIKVVFESLFQPAIDGVTGFIPKVVGAFIQFEIWVLKALIAIKPFGSKIEMIGQFFVGMGVVIAATAAISIGLLVALAAAAMAPVLAFQEMWNAGKQAYDKLSSMSFGEIGTMLIDGLVSGITGGIDKVIGAVTGVADSAIGAAKSVLGIASPSKVFAQLGGFTAEGMAGGIDDGAGSVQSSMESIMTPPAMPQAGAAAAPAPTTASGEGGGNTFNFVFNGVAGAEEAKDSFLEALENFLGRGGGMAPT